MLYLQGIINFFRTAEVFCLGPNGKQDNIRRDHIHSFFVVEARISVRI